MHAHAWNPGGFLQLSTYGILPTNGRDAMITTYQVRHITVSVNSPPGKVYDFVSNPENLPKWATGGD